MIVDSAPPVLDEAPAEAVAAAVVSCELRTLGRHSVHYLAGLIGSLLLGLVSFPIFTRVFSVTEFGTIDLWLRVVLILTAVSKLGLQSAALRFYDAHLVNEQGWARCYYSTMFFGVLMTSAVVAAVFIGMVHAPLWRPAGGPVTRLLWLAAILMVLRAMGSILCAFLRVEERTKAFNLIAVATKGLTIAAVCALLSSIGRSATTYFTGVVAVELVIVLGMTGYLFRRDVLSFGSFDRAQFQMFAAFGIPLVVYESAFNLLGSADRFLVRYFLGGEALGVYSVAYGLSQTVSDLLLTPLNLALMPIYMRLWSSAGRETTIGFLTTALSYFVLVAMGILAVTAAASKDIVVLLASSKYSGAERLIPMLLAGLLFYTSHVFVAAGLMLEKKTMWMAAILLVSAGFNILLNCLLLPWLGLMGGAAATLASYFLCVTALGRAAYASMPIGVHVGTLIRYLVAGAGAWFAAAFMPASSAVTNVMMKSVTVSAVYLAVLLVIDARSRRDGIAVVAYTRTHFWGGREKV